MAKEGRPTKYSKEMQALSDAYVEGGYIEAGQVIPSVAGLAIMLRVARETLYNWSREHDEFLGTLEQLKMWQENALLNSGLDGTFNSTITKLVLTNHGYSDKPEPPDNEEAATLNITFEVKDAQADIKVTNAKP